MEILKTCIITSIDDTYTEFVQSLFESGRKNPKANIFICVKNEDVQFLSLSSPQSERYIRNLQCDLLIIEDSWKNVVMIVQTTLACPGIKRVVVATSADAAEALLKIWQEGPSVLTLDFKLTKSDDWPQRTENLYKNIKKQWPITPVISITAWESDAESKPFPE